MPEFDSAVVVDFAAHKARLKRDAERKPLSFAEQAYERGKAINKALGLARVYDPEKLPEFVDPYCWDSA